MKFKERNSKTRDKRCPPVRHHKAIDSRNNLIFDCGKRNVKPYHWRNFQLVPWQRGEWNGGGCNEHRHQTRNAWRSKQRSTGTARPEKRNKTSKQCMINHSFYKVRGK